jgi:NAD(P)-dependent dehydrogenase (short-subunit alcohol dehydrogenase family)
MATTKRIALVTGGMGGLGEAICIKLTKLGDTVATTYSPGNTKAQEWLKSMKERGYHFYAYPCDVTDWESCQACVRRLTEALGPVDVLVNNAGVTRDMTFWTCGVFGERGGRLRDRRQYCDQRRSAYAVAVNRVCPPIRVSNEPTCISNSRQFCGRGSNQTRRLRANVCRIR